MIIIIILCIFIFLAIFMIIFYRNREKINFNFNCNYNIDENQKIPRVVYFTYNKLDKIPKYVYDNINKYCSGYQIEFYDDKRCEDFLLEYYGNKAVEIFKNIISGAHKADFWRYCILYAKGGYYFDIKTNFQKHIDKIFTCNDAKYWYTVLAYDNNGIYNGIIVTAPKNPILWENIIYIVKNTTNIVDMIKNNYFIFTKLLYNTMKKYIKNMGIGKKEYNDWKCILFIEECVKGNDRYGLSCQIKDENGVVEFITRYNDFPWK